MYRKLIKDYVQNQVYYQWAKKLVSDSPGLVDFAIGLVIFVLNLPDYRRIVINPANQKGFWG